MTTLPCNECRGQCCTFPAMSRREFKTIRKKYGIPRGAKVLEIPGMVVVTDGLTDLCPYLVDGRCSVYEHRPKVCREYGVNPAMPCQYLYPEKAQEEADKLFFKYGE